MIPGASAGSVGEAEPLFERVHPKLQPLNALLVDVTVGAGAVETAANVSNVDL